MDTRLLATNSQSSPIAEKIQSSLNNLNTPDLRFINHVIFDDFFKCENNSSSAHELTRHFQTISLKAESDKALFPEESERIDTRLYQQFALDIRTVERTATLWRVLFLCPSQLNDLALQKMGDRVRSYNRLSDYMLVRALRRELAELPCKLRFYSSNPLFRPQVIFNVRKERPVIPTAAELIGTAESPGALIQMIRDYSSRSQSLNDSQKDKMEKIAGFFLSKTKRPFFSEDLQERIAQYEKLAENMYIALRNRDDQELEIAFSEEEGGLCELAEVCFMGWHQRIRQFIPSSHQLRGLEALKADLLEQRRLTAQGPLSKALIDLAYGDQADLYYGNVHFKAAIQHLLNDRLSLNYFPEEIGPYEEDAIAIMNSSLLSLERNGQVLAEYFAVKKPIKVLERHFASLSFEEQNLLIDEILSFYHKACTNSSLALLDRCSTTRDLFAQIAQHNEEECEQLRNELLQKDFDLLFSRSGIQLKLTPTELKTLLQELKLSNRRVFHLNPFQFSTLENPALQLAEFCCEHGVSLSSQQEEVLARYSSLTSQKQIVREAVSQQAIDQHIVRYNCDLFKKILVEEDTETGRFELTNPGKGILLYLAGEINYPNTSERSDSHLYSVLPSLQLAVNSPSRFDLLKISDRDQIREKMKVSHQASWLMSDQLLADTDFIKEIVLNFPQNILLYNHCPVNDEAIEEFLTKYQNNKPAIVRMLLANPIFEKNPQRLARVLNLIMGSAPLSSYAMFAKAYLLHTEDVLNILPHIEPSLMVHMLPLIGSNVVIRSMVAEQVFELLPSDDYERVFHSIHKSLPTTFLKHLLKKCDEQTLKRIFYLIVQQENLSSDLLTSYVKTSSTALLAEILTDFNASSPRANNKLLVQLALEKTLSTGALNLSRALTLYFESCLEADQPSRWVTRSMQDYDTVKSLLESSHFTAMYPILKAMPPAFLSDETIVMLLTYKTPGQLLQRFITESHDLDALPSVFVELSFLKVDDQQKARILQRVSTARNIHTKSLINIASHPLIYETLLNATQGDIDGDFIVKGVIKLHPNVLQQLLKQQKWLLQAGGFTVNWLIQDCPINLFTIFLEAMPAHIRASKTEALRILRSPNLPPHMIPDAVKKLTQKLRSDNAFIEELIEITYQDIIPELLTCIPKQRRSEQHVLALVKRCAPDYVGYLATKLDPDFSKNLNVMKSIVQKINPAFLYSFMEIPDVQVASEDSFLIIAIDRCPSKNMLQLVRSIPPTARKKSQLMQFLVSKAHQEDRREVISHIDAQLQQNLIETFVELCPDTREKKRTRSGDFKKSRKDI